MFSMAQHGPFGLFHFRLLDLTGIIHTYAGLAPALQWKWHLFHAPVEIPTEIPSWKASRTDFVCVDKDDIPAFLSTPDSYTVVVDC